MNDVVIRDIEERDLPDLKLLIVEAFGDGWNLGRFNQGEDSFQALMEVYLSVFLNSSTFGRVAEKENKIIGAILTCAKGEPKKYRILQKDIAPNTLSLLLAPEDQRADVVEHLSTSFRVIGSLLENKESDYDGSLEFIAVSKQYQGSKIGKTLWNEASAYFKSKGVKSLYLITDSACNLGFYDYNGFAKVVSSEAVYNYTTGQKKFEICLYDYHFCEN